jgi:hypothetical protein
MKIKYSLRDISMASQDSVAQVENKSVLEIPSAAIAEAREAMQSSGLMPPMHVKSFGERVEGAIDAELSKPLGQDVSDVSKAPSNANGRDGTGPDLEAFKVVEISKALYTEDKLNHLDNTTVQAAVESMKHHDATLTDVKTNSAPAQVPADQSVEVNHR